MKKVKKSINYEIARAALLNEQWGDSQTEDKKANRYMFQSSGKVSTVNQLQKAVIQEAVLAAIANGTYYNGLEEKACKAVSYINQFNDGEIISELIDTQTGKKYRELG